MPTININETVLWEAGGAATAGTIPNVKILGENSRNRRRYTEPAMRQAAKLYEGTAVYIDHSKDKGRSAMVRFGKLTNVKYVPEKREVRGDLVYLTKQTQMAEMLQEDLERKLNFFGLSHDADGEYRFEGSTQVIESISRVKSVDLVSDPATNTSLLEQAITEQDDPAADPVAEAFKAAVMAVLDDTTLDLAGKMAKIETILEQQEALTTDPAAPAEPAAPMSEQVLMQHLKRLAEQVETLTKAAKPKKYITAPVPEQTLPAPTDLTDKAKMRKWLTS